MDQLLLGATIPDAVTFAIAGLIALVGALGVVLARNPVHSALMLIMTLFGVAVLFVEEDAQFLAAVQVIVYAGAIVVLFLFVIMLLGVDREESFRHEPMPTQRYVAIGLGLLVLAEVILLGRERWPLGARSVSGHVRVAGQSNTYELGKSLFTTYLLPFEITSALLVIAVIGAAVLARRPRGSAAFEEEEPALPAGGLAGGPAARAVEAESAARQLAAGGEPVGQVLEEEEGVSVVERPEP